MKKFKMYTLYARVHNTEYSKYDAEEYKKDDKKRPASLMYGTLIEELDNLTSKYDSEDDLLDSYPEEVFEKNLKLYDPVIIVDKDIKDRSKSYVIYDIVYSNDKKELDNQQNIRIWLEEYLKNNLNKISKFRGIKEIYENLKAKYPSMTIDRLIEATIQIYLENDNYKKYREAYFTLKKLDKSKEKNHEVHR